MACLQMILAEVAEQLAVLIVKFESATVEEMPALIDEAKDAARTVLRCWRWGRYAPSLSN
jgi:hypothetical protein